MEIEIHDKTGVNYWEGYALGLKRAIEIVSSTGYVTCISYEQFAFRILDRLEKELMETVKNPGEIKPDKVNR